MLPTRSCYLLFSFLSVQNLVCQVQSLLTKCEADKLRSSLENTLSNSPVLFFPGYNDIITSYCIGRSNEANRNISSCERKVKVQLPSLKLLGFFFFCVFPGVPTWPCLATRWALVLTGMMEMIHAVFVLTLCGTKYKVWTGCGGSLCAAGVLTAFTEAASLWVAGNSDFSCRNSSAKQH